MYLCGFNGVLFGSRTDTQSCFDSILSHRFTFPISFINNNSKNNRWQHNIVHFGSSKWFSIHHCVYVVFSIFPILFFVVSYYYYFLTSSCSTWSWWALLLYNVCVSINKIQWHRNLLFFDGSYPSLATPLHSTPLLPFDVNVHGVCVSVCITSIPIVA